MQKQTPEEFVVKANIVHNSKYNYSKVNYINSKIKVCILCPDHGEFWQIPNNHLNGQGCLFCGKQNMAEKQSLTHDQFIDRANIKHNSKYNYIKVNYIDSKTKIEIMCSKHGSFEQKPNAHLNGHGCPKCAQDKRTINQTFIQDQFIEMSKKTHGNFYDYSKIIYNKMKSKVIIICPIHKEFEQLAYSHIQGQGCPKCNESKGEKRIRQYLNSMNINFIPEYRFDDCKNIKTLPFDFYLPELKICIEFDGIQHFKPTTFGGISKEVALNNLKIQQEKDKLKTQYCKSNNIKLLRISYLKYINIERILTIYLYCQ